MIDARVKLVADMIGEWDAYDPEDNDGVPASEFYRGFATDILTALDEMEDA